MKAVASDSPESRETPGTSDSAGTPHLPQPRNTLVVGDCLKTMASWPQASIDLIFADPPYNIGYKYDHYEDTRDDHDYINWTCKWIDACARLLKPTGSMYVLIGDEYAAETRLHLKELEKQRKLVFRNWIIWHYTFGQNCKIKFNRSHAHLFYCVGPEALTRKDITTDPPFVFNRDAVAIPSARQTTYADVRANPKGKLPDDTWYLRPQEVEGNYFRADEDTWYQSRLCGTFKERTGWHPCQLPEALLERIVKLSSNPGQLVFDPFTGSGTTLTVARKLGRDWIGCELSSDYAKRALQRIQNTPVLAATSDSRNGGDGGAPVEKNKFSSTLKRRPSKKRKPTKSPASR